VGSLPSKNNENFANNRHTLQFKFRVLQSDQPGVQMAGTDVVSRYSEMFFNKCVREKNINHCVYKKQILYSTISSLRTAPTTLFPGGCVQSNTI